LGQYGKIIRLIVNNSKAYTGTGIPSYSAYVTYSSFQEAAIAILALDHTLNDDLLIRASFGSTKYCSHFLRGVECTNKECLYYHYFVDDKQILNNKDDNTVNNKLQSLALEIGDIYVPEVRSRLSDKKNTVKNAVFPTVYSIYSKDFVIENDYNKPVNKVIHTSNSNSNLKTLLNKSEKDKSPNNTKSKEDLNNLFSKKKENK